MHAVRPRVDTLYVINKVLGCPEEHSLCLRGVAGYKSTLFAQRRYVWCDMRVPILPDRYIANI